MSSKADALTTADFITTTHRISGQVQTGTKPLSDVLNDRSLSYVLAFNVYVSRLDRAGELGDRVPAAYLSKENLSLVVVPMREVRAADRSRFSVVQYKALMTLTGFEVRGLFVGPQRMDLRLFSPAMLDTFVVLTDATAQVIGQPDLCFTGEAIMVNRGRMQSLCLSE